MTAPPTMLATATASCVAVGVVGDHPCPSRFFETVFNASGMQALVAQYGDWFSYTKNPRAQIFRRDQPLVEDMDSMLRLMRWVSTLLACCGE